MRFRAAVIGAAAALACAAQAGAAQGKSVLWLRQFAGTTRTAVGAPVDSELDVYFPKPGGEAECAIGDEGKLTSNGAVSDRIAYSTHDFTGCVGEDAIHGAITSVSLIAGTAGGLPTAKLVAAKKILILQPNWCVYELTKFGGRFTSTRGTFAVTVIGGEATAKLDTKATFGEPCAATLVVDYKDVFNEVLGGGTFGWEEAA